MEKNKLATIGVVMGVLILAVAIILTQNFQGGLIQDTPAETIAKWIGDNSVLYVQTGCTHCIEQEDLFGANVRYLTIIDCVESENRQVCINEGIEVTPTWIINGQKYEGKKTIEELKELTGYQD